MGNVFDASTAITDFASLACSLTGWRAEGHIFNKEEPMDMFCEQCGRDAGFRPLIERLCGLCHREKTGEGVVVECRECKQRKYINYFPAKQNRLLATVLCFGCDYWTDYAAKARCPESV